MIERSLFPRMAAALLALLGLLDSAYLTLERFVPDVSMVCLTGGGCQTVQSSQWSMIPPGNGIPVAVLGLLAYGALMTLALLALQRDTVGGLSLPSALLLLSSAGVLFSLYLTYLQLFVIGAICSWCVFSALFELGIWAAALIDWRAWHRSEISSESAAQPKALHIH